MRIKMNDGNAGRIPNWAKLEVEKQIRESDNSFYKAFHYFAYDNITENMSKEQNQLWRAFDHYAKTNNIGE